MTPASTRHTLPQRREADTRELLHDGKSYSVTVGFFPDTRPGEVFINGAKAGSDVEAVMRDGAVLLSIALQYGVPLHVMAGAITRSHDGKPMTIVGRVVDLLAAEGNGEAAGSANNK